MKNWLIPSDPITVELCKETCLINGFLYAGVQDGYLNYMHIYYSCGRQSDWVKLRLINTDC